MYRRKYLFSLMVLMPIISISVWYLVSFHPFLSKLNEISEIVSRSVPDVSEKLYLIVHANETDNDIRKYAMRQAYRSLSYDATKEGNISWHLNNFLWYFSSYLYFTNREIFYLWIDCSLYGCGKGISEASLKFFGKNIKSLSEAELITLVSFVRAPPPLINRLKGT
ncbi:MAG: transglycosylase domain-containing protein [Gammaproteobacteria bacterium]|nr:transglycosylase domain-containing protein [Gammaproteobacteria bacterium]